MYGEVFTLRRIYKSGDIVKMNDANGGKTAKIINVANCGGYECLQVSIDGGETTLIPSNSLCKDELKRIKESVEAYQEVRHHDFGQACPFCRELAKANEQPAWAVENGERYEDRSIMGIFTTEKLAKKACRDHNLTRDIRYGYPWKYSKITLNRIEVI